MEPNQNTNTVQNTASAPTIASVSSTPSTASNASVGSSKPGSDVVFRDKPKKSHGMLYGMILLAILAAGGIGFGVWAMMDGSAQKEALNLQINALKQQNNELQEKNAELEEKVKKVEEVNDDSEEVTVEDNVKSFSDEQVTGAHTECAPGSALQYLCDE